MAGTTKTRHDLFPSLLRFSHLRWLKLGLARLRGTRCLPCRENQIDNGIDALVSLHNGEDGRAAFTHPPAIPVHDVQVSAHCLGQVDLVHDEQVRLGDARPALAGDLVSARDVDYVNDEVCELARVVCCEVVAARLDEEKIGVEAVVQVGERGEVDGNVFADGGVGAAAGFDGDDALAGGKLGE